MVAPMRATTRAASPTAGSPQDGHGAGPGPALGRPHTGHGGLQGGPDVEVMGGIVARPPPVREAFRPSVDDGLPDVTPGVGRLPAAERLPWDQ